MRPHVPSRSAIATPATSFTRTPLEARFRRVRLVNHVARRRRLLNGYGAAVAVTTSSKPSRKATTLVVRPLDGCRYKVVTTKMGHSGIYFDPSGDAKKSRILRIPQSSIERIGRSS